MIASTQQTLFETSRVRARRVPTRIYHVLNLGVGIQSRWLLQLFLDGKILNRDGAPVTLDFSVFSDTQAEPQHVYRSLAEVKKLPTKLIVASKGSLSEDLMRGENSTKQRFASIPCFTFHKVGPLTFSEAKKVAIIRRQCTKEYKLDVITKAIRQEIGLKPRQRFPVDTHIVQYIGISLDEAGRAGRVQNRFRDVYWAEPKFPLIDLNLTRSDCQANLLANGIQAGRSACAFCPYHDDEEWQWLKDNDAEAWDLICRVDRALRTPGVIVNRKMHGLLFLHRSCLPIWEVDFQNPLNNYRRGVDLGELDLPGFNVECEGMCGV